MEEKIVLDGYSQETAVLGQFVEQQSVGLSQLVMSADGELSRHRRPYLGSTSQHLLPEHTECRYVPDADNP